MNEQQNIKVLVKEAYGRRAYYPNCEVSKHFTRGLGQKTLTDHNLSMLKNLGKEIEYFIVLGNQTVKVLL